MKALKKKIAIVHQDPRMLSLATQLLEPDFECCHSADTEGVLDFLRENKPDLLVMGYDFAGESGIHLTRLIREQDQYKDLPIIFTSSEASIDDKIKAFEAGASDFIFQPFDHREFVLRVKAKFREEKIKFESVILLGNCRLDFYSRRVFVSEKEVNLTRRQFDILAHLASKKNQAVSREELIGKISQGKENLSKRNIDTQISYMKKNLQSFDWAFEAVHGQGYRLVEGKKDLDN